MCVWSSFKNVPLGKNMQFVSQVLDVQMADGRIGDFREGKKQGTLTRNLHVAVLRPEIVAQERCCWSEAPPRRV